MTTSQKPNGKEACLTHVVIVGVKSCLYDQNIVRDGNDMANLAIQLHTMLGITCPPALAKEEAFMSNNGLPSMTALLGMLALAGYQNRDKIAEMLGGQHGASGGGAAQSGLGGLLGQLSGGLGPGGVGGLLSGGLGELVDRFKNIGHGDTVNSWVGTGPNKQIAPSQVQEAIGPDVLETLAKQTGLSHEEILARLSRELPNAVDKYTPLGQLPASA
jgi:uncharacterized protein YidB (DUF937 family)